MPTRQEIEQQLRQGDDEEFDYHGDIGSINAIAEGETRVEISHFVVKRSERRQGHGKLLFETLLDVLRDHGYNSATVKIQALEDGTRDDPIMGFLKNYGFRHIRSFEHHNWGTCVEAYGYF